MKWTNNLRRWATDTVLRYIPESRIRIESELRREKKGKAKLPSEEIKRSSEVFTPKTVKNWKDAIALATDPENPSFSDLADLYRNLLLDGHTYSVIESRLMRVMRSRFLIVNEKGEANPELKPLLERPWFEQFIRQALLSKFTGIKVLEIFHTDENLELYKTIAIPMEHTLPKKGLILKEPGDETGWNYKEGILAPYYLQVGDDTELGLLADLAPLVLAKKLSSGSWLDFIEKFGIPFRSINTDNMTAQRQEELLTMLINSISNHVAVLQGSETINVTDTPRTDPHKVFMEFLSYLNSEISKRVLGQDGTTDNKDASGTYGSLKVLQEVANDRHESDKLFIQYVVNKELFPRLVSLSSFYKNLNGHRFDWDESEDMDRGTFIDKVVQLTNAGFVLDPVQVAEKTGLPIVGTASAPLPEPQEGGKKKSLKATVEAIYSHYAKPHNCGSHEPGLPALRALDISQLTRLIDDIARQLHEGSLKPADLNENIIRYNYDAISESAGKGFGAAWGKPTEKNITTVTKLQESIYRFSGAKTYQQLQQMNELLVDEKGKIRNLQDFKNRALEVHETYNRTYLEVERQNALLSAQGARQWADIQENKDLFPNLRYRTVGDDRVREAHDKLNGIVKPVDDPFWDSYYPPNGWRCRCSVKPTNEAVTDHKPGIEPDKGFAHNVGKTGNLFSADHPYNSIPKADVKDYRQAFELFKVNGPVTKLKGVSVSIFADKSDLKSNLANALLIRKTFKNQVAINPHIEVKGWKNPELTIDGVKADLKSIENEGGIRWGLRSSKEQGAKITVFNLDRMGETGLEFIERELCRNITNDRGRSVAGVYFIRNNQVVYLTRETILKRDFSELKKIRERI